MVTETSFEDLTHGFIADYLEFYPTLGTGLGLHLYDGRTGDCSQVAIDTWLRTLGAWERRLAGAFDRVLAIDVGQDRLDLCFHR